jgi:hypothetical protein
LPINDVARKHWLVLEVNFEKEIMVFYDSMKESVDSEDLMTYISTVSPALDKYFKNSRNSFQSKTKPSDWVVILSKKVP